MAKEPEKPRSRTILTGTARRVTDSVERAREYLKDRPEPFRSESTKPKSFSLRWKKPEVDLDEKPPPDAPEPEGDGGEEGEDEDDD